MTFWIPVTDKERNIAIWQCKRQRNDFSVVYRNPSVSSGGSLEVQGREVKETPNLIFHLKLIRPVPSCGDRAIGPQHTVLPRVLPVLYSVPASNYNRHSLCHIHFDKSFHANGYIPCEKQRLVKVVLDIDDNVPIRRDVKNWPRELPIDPDHLEKRLRRMAKKQSANATLVLSL